jgi:hypothetical protein
VWDEENPDLEEFPIRAKREEPTFLDTLSDIFFLGGRDNAPPPLSGGSKAEPPKEAFVAPLPEVLPEVVVTGGRIAAAVSVPAAAAAATIVTAIAAAGKVLSDIALEKAIERITEPEPEPKPEPKPTPKPQPQPLPEFTITAPQELQTFTVQASPAVAGGGGSRPPPTFATPAFEEMPPDFLEIALRQDLGPFGAEATPKTDVAGIVQKALDVLSKVTDPFANIVPTEVRTPEVAIEPKPTPQPAIVVPIIEPDIEEEIPEFVVPGTKPAPAAPVIAPVPVFEPEPVVIPQPKPEKTPVPDEFAYPVPVVQPVIIPIAEPAPSPAVKPEPVFEPAPAPAVAPKVAAPVVSTPVLPVLLTPFQEAMVPLVSNIGAPKPPQEAEACEPPKKKPRTVCYRGYYREYRNSERKVKWERVPCEPRPKKRKR